MKENKKLFILPLALLVLAGCAGGGDKPTPDPEPDPALTADDVLDAVYDNLAFDDIANSYSYYSFEETGFYEYILGSSYASYDELDEQWQENVKVYDNDVATYHFREVYHDNKHASASTSADYDAIQYVKDDLFYNFQITRNSYGTKGVAGVVAGGYLDLPGNKYGAETVSELYMPVAGNNAYAISLANSYYSDDTAEFSYDKDANAFELTMSISGTIALGNIVSGTGADDAPVDLDVTVEIKGTLDGVVTSVATEQTATASADLDGEALDTPALIMYSYEKYYDVAALDLGDYTDELPTNATVELAASVYGSYRYSDTKTLDVKFVSGNFVATEYENGTATMTYATTSSSGTTTYPTYNATLGGYRLTVGSGNSAQHFEFVPDENGNIVLTTKVGRNATSATVQSVKTYWTEDNYEAGLESQLPAGITFTTNAKMNEKLAAVKDSTGASIFPADMDFGDATRMYYQDRNDPENMQQAYDAYLFIPVADEEAATTLMNSIFAQLEGFKLWDKEEDNQYYYRDGSYFVDDSFVTCNYVQQDVNGDGTKENCLRVWFGVYYQVD